MPQKITRSLDTYHTSLIVKGMAQPTTADEMVDILEEIGDPSELTEFAAGSAAGVLAFNWQDALGDGTPLADLLGDVDKTIELLRRWKEKLASSIDAT